ncbi:MAG: SDR family oxidoreductase [Rhodobacteraceae bacterium]|nr:SDR family oxidoreductase [Paracoccaceae bacterium]
MELKGKTIVITGAGQGIGAAMATRFAAEGARVVVSDRNGENAQRVADRIGGLAVACDVTVEADIQNLVAQTRAHFGPVDLFCSNAGLGIEEPGHAASASNADWQLNWDIHVMAHVYAARAVLPDMIARRSGYLLQMSSAAGLLSQIGNASYSATKHAAVGFAEALAITHGDDGIAVSVICPQYVATPLLGYKAGEMPEDAPNVLSPEVVADVVVEGVRRECFLILPHSDVAKFIRFKSSDYDRWLDTMRQLRRRVVGEKGKANIATTHKLI